MQLEVEPGVSVTVCGCGYGWEEGRQRMDKLDCVRWAGLVLMG